MTLLASENDFDFRAAVKRALAEFPTLKGFSIFLNAATPQKNYGHWKAKLKATASGQWMHNDRYIAKAHETHSSYAFPPEFLNTITTLVFNPDDGIHETLGQTVPLGQVSRFVFNHELGHLTVPRAFGDPRNGKPYPENAADSFATLKHLQENKDDILLPLANGWARAYRFIATGNATHMSSFTTEALLAMRHALNLDDLHGKTLTDFAAAHAEKHSPEPNNINDIKHIYNRYRGWNALYPITAATSAKIVSLAETALKTENAFAFHVGLTLFRPFLHPAGAEVNGIVLKLDEDKRADMEARFEARAQSLGIPSLIRTWKENVDSYCAHRHGPAEPVATAQQKPLKLSIN